MGGGGSKRYSAKSKLGQIIEAPSRNDLGQKALKFSVEQSSVEQSVSMSVNVTAMRYTELDNESKDLLIEAFGDLFMLEGEDYNSLKTKLLLQACTRESSPVDTVLMREGDVGSKLYVVQSGHLEVSIEGDVIRHLSTGALVGEISLLYNAPRSATVKCLTACTFFVLTREAFKQVQGIASSASLLRRSRWLQAVAGVLSLGTVDISRLAGTLETQNFVKGEKIYSENEYSNKVYLIEEGTAELQSADGSLDSFSADEVRQACGVTFAPSAKRTMFTAKGLQSLPELQQNETFSPRQVAEALVVEVPDSEVSTSVSLSINSNPLEVYKGCIVGTTLVHPLPPETDSKYKLKLSKRIGAKMPFSVMVTSNKLQCSYFTVDTFEHMFGSIKVGVVTPTASSTPTGISTPKSSLGLLEESFRSQASSAGSNDGPELNRLQFLSHETCLTTLRVPNPKIEEEGDDENMAQSDGTLSPSRPNRGGPRLDEPRATKTTRFMDESFKELCLLGKGAYGTVTYAREVVNDKYYAVKRIHKADATSTQHIRHIFDECKLLLQMKSPFVAKLAGVYMTADDVVLVFDPVLHGDLWGVIYEVKKHSRGLPIDLVRFYSASIVMGLAHIHKRGIAFRDLKPENIMINEKGYLSIIDFGFAKKIPYLHVDPTGVKMIKMKSYTLCGTPDYLAPEFIFNNGANHSVDIWALGVIIHEMIMLTTPFRPQRKADLTALFVNIASVKKIGLKLSGNIDYRTNDERAAQLISQLLRADPNDRLGALDATIKILDAPFFDEFSSSQLRRQQFPAPFIPDEAIDIRKLKADQNIRYTRAKKPYVPRDAEQALQWEAFETIIAKNTVPSA